MKAAIKDKPPLTKGLSFSLRELQMEIEQMEGDVDYVRFLLYSVFSYYSLPEYWLVNAHIESRTLL